MADIYQTSDGTSVYDSGGKTYDAKTAQEYVAPPAPASTSTTSTGSSTAPIIVTSSQAKGTYNDNVTKMNSAVSNLSASQPKVTTDTSGGAKSTANSSYQYKMPNGSTITVGDPTINRDMLKGATYVSGGDGTDPLAGTFNSGVSQARINGGTYLGQDGNEYYNYDGTAKNDDGSSEAGATDPNIDGAVTAANNAGLDPAVTALYKSSIDNLTQGVNDAKTVLDDASKTLANDPALASAIDSIKAKYDVQMKLMADKNKLLAGSYVANAARSGGFQYANDMTSNFLSEEQDRASGRITDLVNQEQDLILKTQEAFKTGDVKAFNAAQSEYNKANVDKTAAINKLLTATNAAVKAQQAQAKIDATAAKQQISDDIRLSTSLGKSIADTLKTNGITDPTDVDTYLQQVASESGITDVNILKSSVVKAQQDQTKLDSTLENTANNIKNRDMRTGLAITAANKKTSGSTPSGNLNTNQLNTIGSSLDNGDTYDGVTYPGRDDSNYVDAGFYNAIYNNLLTSSPAKAKQFLTKYPPTKNLNPEAVDTPGLSPVIKAALAN